MSLFLKLQLQYLHKSIFEIKILGYTLIFSFLQLQAKTSF